MSTVHETLRAVIFAGLVASAITVLLGLAYVAVSVEQFDQVESYAALPSDSAFIGSEKSGAFCCAAWREPGARLTMLDDMRQAS